MDGLGQTHTIGHKGHVTGGVRHEGKKGRKMWINLSTAYGLVLVHCTDYIQSRLEGQEKWERTSNERDLLKLLKSVKSFLHK